MGWTHRTMELFRTVDGLEAELKAVPSSAGGKPRRVKARTLNGEWESEPHWTSKPTDSGPREGDQSGTPPDFSSATPRSQALPPNRGGYGPNTGVADAHNLAWKLGAVLAGRADRALLGTYEAERRAVARVRHDQIFAREDYREYVADSDWRKDGKEEDVEVLGDVATELGQIYAGSGAAAMDMEGEESGLGLAKTPAEWKGQPGARAPHIWLQGNGEGISSLDLCCGGWMLLSGDRGLLELLGELKSLECVHVGQDIMEVEEREFELAFGVEETGAVLVRPDGYIAARWKEDSSLEEIPPSVQVGQLCPYIGRGTKCFERWGIVLIQ
ncbi:FAD binding domain-containing protein [Apiospora aurea]|uniref:FAD binding domain-containing protein n=1 Tax=Apiospora aurea TaxID=335848 RepID=A0ABR1QN49_9PEZI